jgi:hypothetical protein
MRQRAFAGRKDLSPGYHARFLPRPSLPPLRRCLLQQPSLLNSLLRGLLLQALRLLLAGLRAIIDRAVSPLCETFKGPEFGCRLFCLLRLCTSGPCFSLAILPSQTYIVAKRAIFSKRRMRGVSDNCSSQTLLDSPEGLPAKEVLRRLEQVVSRGKWRVAGPDCTA